MRGVCAKPSKLPDVPAACSRVDENLWLMVGGEEQICLISIWCSWQRVLGLTTPMLKVTSLKISSGWLRALFVCLWREIGTSSDFMSSLQRVISSGADSE